MSSALDSIFKPRAIAVVGASTKKGTISNAILHNLMISGYGGKLFPINPTAEEVLSLKCYATIPDVPGAVDLAVVVVPRDHVAAALNQCGEKGIKGIVVITSGFKEIGNEGIRKEEELVEIVRKYNMSMIGPNCFGVFNTDTQYSFNTTFSKSKPLTGVVGFLTQSGALGEAVLDYAQQIKLGFSMFVSIGNKADVSDNDLLLYWADDPQTKIILLYLENFDRSRRFMEIARDISRKKPIIAMKSGRTTAGAAAISSHTGVLAGLDVGTNAFFDQCGIMRATAVDELFDVLLALTNQPLPQGDRVAVLTNAGGPGILATDAVAGAGLTMARFEQQTLRRLRENLPPVAAVNNPIDVIASGGPDAYRMAMDAVLADKNVDAVICIFVPPIFVDHRAVIAAIVETIHKHGNNKPVLACFMNNPEAVAGSEEMFKHHIPIYNFPESAANALAAMSRYRRLRDRPEGRVPSFAVDQARVQTILQPATQSGKKTIVGEDALAILDAYGIGVARSMNARTEREAIEIAAQLNYPVIMKVDDPAIIHKTDVGGVSPALHTEADVAEAFAGMIRKFGGTSTTCAGVMLQELVVGGVETIIGMNQDPSFGPLMMFGLGGVFVEVMKDVAFKVHPLSDCDCTEMIKSIKGYPLLTGFRGAPPINLEVLEETILRLSQLVTDFPKLQSFDVNPFIVTPDRAGSRAVDARFILM